MPHVGGVVVAHGQLANELLSAAEMVVGEINQIQAVSIGWHDDVEQARSTTAKAVDDTNRGAGVVVLTDMFGGTPTNLVMTYSGSTPIEIITGVNLPMVIKLAAQEVTNPWLMLPAKCVTRGKKTSTWPVN